MTIPTDCAAHPRAAGSPNCKLPSTPTSSVGTGLPGHKIESALARRPRTEGRRPADEQPLWHYAERRQVSADLNVWRRGGPGDPSGAPQRDWDSHFPGSGNSFTARPGTNLNRFTTVVLQSERPQPVTFAWRETYRQSKRGYGFRARYGGLTASRRWETTLPSTTLVHEDCNSG